ncbi:bZIP transcription factor [Colletotrichum tamarilloi]|uniref:BZIP transcription factor n=1 Tax=Colletotrichum tamarilloi TaxID=1209934 RepID=A0ABQ9RFR1_9PEZI|nr:bZIP transcription factor [Colletotrichum tamarilloi]KAK1502841.1 bZIP transcription factor [Colletotrichum tamarilloi]
MAGYKAPLYLLDNRASTTAPFALLAYPEVPSHNHPPFSGGFDLLLPFRLQKLANPSVPNFHIPFSSFLLTTTIFQTTIKNHSAIEPRQNALNHRLQFDPASKLNKIQSTTIHDFSPLFTSAQPSQVDLNYTTASSSSLSSASANILPRDFSVFTTDSQSSWLPSSSPSLPAQPAQQPQFSPPEQSPQQDFVLFDQPRTSQPRHLATHTAIGLNQRRHSSYHLRQNQQGRVHFQQKHRLAQIQASGSNSRSPSVSSPAQSAQFYASSAPSSSAALNRRQRPPVPLFAQSTQGVTNKMDIQGKPLTLWSRPGLCSHVSTDLDLDDFTGFEGGASTTYSSPAMPSVFDVGPSTLGTVSPHDLLIQEPFMSAPNSTALTALTSPSIYNESPDFNDGYDVSPSFDSGDFGSADFDTTAGDPWFPLFPQESTAVTKDVTGIEEIQKLQTDQSPALKGDDLEVVEFTSTSGRRKSVNSSPTSSARHSSVSGVSSRRRDKPLPPIIVEDPSDTTAMKRARNTLAARKSRERKAQRFEDLEEKIRKLEEERDHWKSIALGRS